MQSNILLCSADEDNTGIDCPLFISFISFGKETGPSDDVP